MTLSTTQLLTYAGPPLLGALIGYLTNKVAIRMLFRPLNPWYILGKRVPMTPGIIPSKRHELAENIGDMVGEKLLTATDIGTALSAEPFQDHLYQIVDDQVQDILVRDLGPIQTVIPRHFRAYARIGLRTLKYQLRSGVRTYIDSDQFRETLNKVIPEQLEKFGTRRLDEILRAEDRKGFYCFTEACLEKMAASPDNTKLLARRIQEGLTEAAVSGKAVEDFLPEELVQLICATIEQQAPQLLRRTADMLAEPSMRDRLVIAIKGGVEDFLDSLGPMAAMAKGFIDLDNMDGTIRIWLEKKEDDLADWLQQPDIQERAARALADQTKTFLATPLANLLIHVEQEKQEAVCYQLAEKIMGMLSSEKMQMMISDAIRNQFEAVIDHGRLPLADCAALLLSKEQSERMRRSLVNELTRVLRSEQTGELLDKIINTMVDRVTSKPLGILQNLMPTGVRNGVTEYIVLTANKMLVREVPGLVRTLNIREMVTEKVDSLDLMRLEGLLLSIMEEQFKYINLFGALLGFFIGFLNLLTMLV
ncbi:hypothetical protein VU01_10205 [Candidatus Electrothrix marina]|uniref:DUF445 family protein n=1 Tax=Candidatus Electrothrix marina TaxID=1859130 RepID=A0A444JGV5_9BACT|nr:hypothetical protein VU01_10205 [Candidatus Electrothrix marina]